MNFSLKSLSLSLCSNSPFIQQPGSRISREASFSKISLSKFSSSFFSTFSSGNSRLTFDRLSFDRFINAPIQISNEKSETQYEVNKVINEPLTYIKPSGVINIFHCSFQNCKTSPYLSISGGILIFSSSQKVRIGFCSFINCNSESISNAGAINIREVSNSEVCLFSNCFNNCSGGQYLSFGISAISSIVSVNQTMIDNCKNVKHGQNTAYTSDTFAKTAVISQYNASRCTASINSGIKLYIAPGEKEFAINHVTLVNNKCGESCFRVGSTTDSLPFATGKLRFWNIVGTKKISRNYECIGKFEMIEGELFDFAFKDNEGEYTALTFVRQGNAAVYDSVSDKPFFQTQKIQWGEGCVVDRNCKTKSVLPDYEKACYVARNVEVVWHIDWPAIGTGFVVCLLFFVGLYLIMFGIKRYRKKINDAIDSEVIGDLTSIVHP